MTTVEPLRTPLDAAFDWSGQVTTSATSVATDGLSGFTLGAALLALLVAGYYLLRRRRTAGAGGTD